MASSATKSRSRREDKSLGSSTMTTQPNTLTPCPYCGAWLVAKRIEAHKADRCPKAPPEVVAARRHIHLPAEPQLHSSPTSQDKQINPLAKTTRMDDGVFYVSNVLRSGGSWRHHLSAECSYCHRTIEIRAYGQSSMPQYARDEACRLALLEHLRTDHASKSQEGA